MLSQWREMARSFSGREAQFGTLAVASVARRAGDPGRDQLPGRAPQQALGPDGRQAVLAVGPDAEDPGGAEKPVAINVFAPSDEFQRFRDRLDEYQYPSKQVSVEYIDVDQAAVARASNTRCSTLGTVVFEYDGRTERVTSDGEQELTNGLIKVVQGKQQKVYFVQGHGEKRHGRQPSATATARSLVARQRELHRRQAGAGAAEGRARRTPSC